MSGLVKRKFFSRFIANGEYIVHSGVTMIWIDCIGQGGGGGGGATSGQQTSGGAGGGGAMSWAVFNAADIPLTSGVRKLDVDIGNTRGAGGTQSNNGQNGATSIVKIPSGATADGSKFILQAFGGGGGAAGTGPASGAGGGGGGSRLFLS